MSKVILITGSTDGIGKLAAQKLAADGHQVYLHGRNGQKLDNTINEIKAQTGIQNIKGFIADFSDLDAVAKMINQIKAELSGIDVLINNAGIFKTSNPLNKDGFDVRFVVNYFAPYVLTNAILPLLKKKNSSRIINLSSAAQAAVSKEALSGQVQLSDQGAYAQSKLAILMWSFYLAKNEPAISTIALNPGSLLNTNMVREAYGKFWSSADKGANIIYDLAVSDNYSGISGKYFDNDRGGFGQAHPDAYSDQTIEQLIKDTEGLL